MAGWTHAHTHSHRYTYAVFMCATTKAISKLKESRYFLPVAIVSLQLLEVLDKEMASSPGAKIFGRGHFVGDRSYFKSALWPFYDLFTPR